MRLGALERDQHEARSVYIEKDFFQGGLWDGVVEDHGGHLLVTLQYLEEGNNLRVPGKQKKQPDLISLCAPHQDFVLWYTTEMV